LAKQKFNLPDRQAGIEIVTMSRVDELYRYLF